MKKFTLTLIAAMICCMSFGQTWTSGSGILYNNPTTTKVGVGITNPSELLQINGGALKIVNSSSANDRAVNMLKIGDGSYIQIGEWEADDKLSFKANSYNFTGGNVGIGTVSPKSKLHLEGSMFIPVGCGLNIGNTTNSGLYTRLYHDGGWSYIDFDDFLALDGKTVVVRANLGVGTAYPAEKFQVTGNSYFNGKVGIGTTYPSYPLHVIGHSYFNGTLEVNNSVSSDYVAALKVKSNRDLTRAICVETPAS